MKLRERLTLALVGLLLVALAIQSCRLADSDALVAARTLKESGWTASTAKPKIPFLPAGAKPVATVTGGVRYKPLPRPSAPGPATSGNPPPDDDHQAGSRSDTCDLDSLTVDLDCRAEIVRIDAVPAARLWVHGFIRSQHDERDLPWRRVGDDVSVGQQPVETAEPEVAIALPHQRKWWGSARAGVSTYPEVVVGASLGRGHWGGWADYRRSTERATIAGGAEFRW